MSTEERSAYDTLVDGWSITLHPSDADEWAQLAGLIETGNCVPHQSLYEMIGSDLPFRSRDQTAEVKILAKTPSGLGFRFGARVESVIERAASHGLVGASPSILFAFGQTLAHMKIMTPGDLLYMPLDRLVVYDPGNSRPTRELRVFKIFCDRCFEDVGSGDGGGNPYDCEFDDKYAPECVQLDVEFHPRNWRYPSEIFLFVQR